MMRLTLACTLAFLLVSSILVPDQSNGQDNKAGGAPFGQLTPAAQAQLDKVLENWQTQSQGTKTLDIEFLRFHYDATAAPANVPAHKAEGIIKYAAPDRGLIRVDQIVFFAGQVNGNNAFKTVKNKFQEDQKGEHWVCNGEQLIEFDHNERECRIQNLPPAMRGKNIISSPLPFVFNLDAAQMKQRYWVRQTQGPSPEVILLEVWPKRREDRAQYKMVQVALEANTFLPKALVMYAPNFDVKLAPIWDHYEFKTVKRNAIANGFSKFLGNFIPEKPPANWKIIQGDFIPPVDPPAQPGMEPQAPMQQAQRPGTAPRR